MHPDSFERLLSDYARQPVPLQSNATRTDVWAEIKRRRSKGVWLRVSRWIALTELGGRPSLAAAALAFAALVGVVPAAVVSHAANESRLARQSIHLEAFSVHSKGIAMVLTKPLSGTPGER